MIKRFFCIATAQLSLLFCFAPLSHAQLFGIVATVNDDAISSAALDERISVIIHTNDLPNNDQTRKKLVNQAVHSLINETLQHQRAQELGLRATEGELQRALASIEKKNQLPAGKIEDFMRSKKVPWDAFIRQIKTQILWQKLIARVIRPTISISESDIQTGIESLKAQGKKEYDLAEVIIPFVPTEESAALDTANAIMHKAKSSKDLKAIISNYSNTKNNHIGWISEDILEAKIKESIAAKQSNSVVGPFRSPGEFRVIFIQNTRSTADDLTAQQAEEFLMVERLEQESKHYIKKLRQGAFIEIRI